MTTDFSLHSIPPQAKCSSPCAGILKDLYLYDLYVLSWFAFHSAGVNGKVSRSTSASCKGQILFSEKVPICQFPQHRGIQQKLRNKTDYELQNTFQCTRRQWLFLMTGRHDTAKGVQASRVWRVDRAGAELSGIAGLIAWFSLRASGKVLKWGFSLNFSCHLF